MKCSDISSCLVDFLYEEMPASKRAEFLAHLEGCASCSAEVKASTSALGHARVALRGPLAEDPPARVHAHVLEAARAAAVARRVDTTPAKERFARPPEPEGFFSRLWKTPWFVPAMGAAGVATVVLLVRVMRNPQILPQPVVTEVPSDSPAQPQQREQARSQAEDERAPSAAQPPAIPPGRDLTRRKVAGSSDRSLAGNLRATVAREKAEAKAPAPGSVSFPAKKQAISPPRADIANDERSALATGAGSSRPWAEPPPPREATAARTHKGGSIDLLDQAVSAHSRGGLDDAKEMLADKRARPSPPADHAVVAARPAPTGAPSLPAVRALAPASPPVPPATAAVPAARRVYAGAEPASAKQEKSAVALEKRHAEAEARHSASGTELQAQTSTLSASRAASDGDKARADEKGSGDSKQAAALKERVRKAEKLFAERKWTEAAAAFRALIAEAPSHPSVHSWRQRLRAAEQAQ
jgi:hypothetical protein